MKRNAELHRGQRQAFFQDRAVGVVAADRFAALGVLAAGLQFGGHLFEHVVLDGLVVVGDVALGLAVVVGLAHRQRVEGQMAGDGVHHFFDGDHTLRAAEAAVRGVGRGVGLAAMAVDRGIAQVIRVVGVEHGAVDDRVRQVRRTAAVARQLQLDAVQAPAVVEADVVFDIEGVALAGHQHVFDARQTHLGRLPGKARDHRTQARRAGGLSLLAAETAAHAAHVDDDLVHRHVEHFGHQLLHLGGVLRGAVDDHAAVFGGHHRGNLGFQVEVFLAADMQRALDAMLRGRQRRCRIAALMGVAVQHEVLVAVGLDHVQHRLQVFVFDHCGQRRFARGFQVAGGHGQHHLADELHGVDGQQRITRQQRADVFRARHVFVGDDDTHAVEGVAGRGVDVEDFGVGAVGQARIQVQLVGEFQAVVDVLRFAGYVLGGAVVLDAATDAGGQILGEQLGQFGLGFCHGVMVRHKRSPEFRCAAFAAR